MPEDTQGQVITPDASPAVDPPDAPAETVSSVGSAALATAGYQSQTKADEQIAWRAAEFAERSRTPAWMGLVAIGALLVAMVVYFLNKDVITAVLVFVALIGLGFATSQKPKEQSYVVDRDGISVGTKMYYYPEFHSFSVREEANGSSLVLVPLKRFMPAINIYVPSEYDEQVVDVVSSILPMEQHKPDILESISRRFRL